VNQAPPNARFVVAWGARGRGLRETAAPLTSSRRRGGACDDSGGGPGPPPGRQSPAPPSRTSGLKGVRCENWYPRTPSMNTEPFDWGGRARFEGAFFSLRGTAAEFVGERDGKKKHLPRKPSQAEPFQAFFLSVRQDGGEGGRMILLRHQFRYRVPKTDPGTAAAVAHHRRSAGAPPWVEAIAGAPPCPGRRLGRRPPGRGGGGRVPLASTPTWRTTWTSSISSATALGWTR